MPFTYEDTIQGERRNALTIPAATSDVLREQFAQTFEENPIMALRRFSQLAEDQTTGPRLSAETARARLKDAGMEKDLVINDAGITEAALLTLMDRKRVEKRRQEIFARSEGGAGELAARFGVAVATTLSDPISASLNFVPVVGQARYARWLSAARSMGGRLAVRGAVGAAEGVAGAAIAEIPIYAMRTQEQADYDMVDSLMNVTFGGVIGAGLHTTVGSAAELISRRLPARQATPRVEPTIGEAAPIRAPEPLPADIQLAIFEPVGAQRAVESMPPMAQQAALREAVAQAVEGVPVEVTRLVRNEPALTPAGEADTLARSITDWQQGRVNLATREQSDGSTSLLVEGKELARVPAGQAVDQNAASRALLQQLKVAYAREGRTFPSRIADMNRAEFGIAYRAGALPETEIDAADIGTVVRDEGAGLSVDTDAMYDKLVRDGVIPARTQMQPVAGSPEDPEFRSATEHAETTLARDVEPTTEANLKAAEEEAVLADTDLNLLAERLGVDVKNDPDMAAVIEGAEKAERWARVAELATVCLVRGG